MDCMGFRSGEMRQIVPEHIVGHNLGLASSAVGQMVESIGTAAHFGNGSDIVLSFLDYLREFRVNPLKY